MNKNRNFSYSTCIVIIVVRNTGLKMFVRIFELRYGRLTRHGERDADNDDNNKIIKLGDVWKERRGRKGGAAVIHQFGFGTFNVAVLGETLPMLPSVRGEDDSVL